MLTTTVRVLLFTTIAAMPAPEPEPEPEPPMPEPEPEPPTMPDFLRNGYYEKAQGCDEVLNDYCNGPWGCVHYRPGKYIVARYDGPSGGDRWRCYLLETLSADTRTYVSGSAFCTRNRVDQLPGVLADCKAARPPPPSPSPPPPPPPPPPPAGKGSGGSNEPPPSPPPAGKGSGGQPSPPPPAFWADGYYAAAENCDEALNSWCMTNCGLYGPGKTIVARYDGPSDKRWRCFLLETLSADTRVYVSGADYCTRNRNNQIPAVLSTCKAARPPPPPSPPPPPPPPLGKGSGGSDAPPPPTPAFVPYLNDGFYGKAEGCDRTLNSWCMTNCGLYTPGSVILARYDKGAGGDRWRCYMLETLSADTRTFVSGSAFCTRNRDNQASRVTHRAHIPVHPYSESH